MVNREHLIAYLLHQMPETDRLEFAEQWFTDSDLDEQLRATEAELLDAYVRGELPRQQQEQVERYLLASEEQRRKLEFSAALHRALPSQRRRPRISWLSLCAAAAIVILASTVIWIALQNRELRSEIARLQQNAKPLQGEVYSASLASSVRGGAGERTIALPKDARMLRLDLGLDDGEIRGSYAAALSISGRTVWREEPVRTGNRGQASFATMWIPAEVLVPGNYTLVLETGGVPVAYYNFAIARRD